MISIHGLCPQLCGLYYTVLLYCMIHCCNEIVCYVFTISPTRYISQYICTSASSYPSTSQSCWSTNCRRFQNSRKSTANNKQCHSKATCLGMDYELTPKGHESSKENCATIIKQEQYVCSTTSVSIVPEVTPLITQWTHEEFFTGSVADILTVISTRESIVFTNTIIR